MDLAETLIRTVVRGFYETKHVLVIDALMVHSALVNEDLARLLGMQQKDLRKLCGKLKEDRLLAVYVHLKSSMKRVKIAAYGCIELDTPARRSARASNDQSTRITTGSTTMRPSMLSNTEFFISLKGSSKCTSRAR